MVFVVFPGSNLPHYVQVELQEYVALQTNIKKYSALGLEKYMVISFLNIFAKLRIPGDEFHTLFKLIHFPFIP